MSCDQSANLITAQVTVEYAGAPAGNPQIRWNDGDINVMASVTGEIQGATLNAQRIAR